MSVFDEISKHGVVPVIALDDPANALPLADALIEGGLPVAEITYRTEAAQQTIESIAEHRPNLLVGAGTVITKDQIDACQRAGSRFALAPGFEPHLLTHAQSVGLPYAPGIMTPSDLQAALALGCSFVKFFPAMPAGGPKMLAAIAGPYAHTGIGFNPTGGVTLGNLGDWLAMPQVRAVGGTWIATREDIAEKRWDDITAKARSAVEAVAQIRSAT